jgi:hypothetical protein
MGKEQDMKQRRTLPRVDDKDRKERVAEARKLIYDKRTAVNGKAVESILQFDSLVPISVRQETIYLFDSSADSVFRMPFPTN